MRMAQDGPWLREETVHEWLPYVLLGAVGGGRLGVCGARRKLGRHTGETRPSVSHVIFVPEDPLFLQS